MTILYIGTGEIGIPTLHSLFNSQNHQVVGVVTQPDRPSGRHLIVHPPPIKTLALAQNIPVLQPEKLRNDLEPILRFQPDLIVVMAYGQILPQAILQLPKVACLNLHASLLPRHRGASPIHAALLEGDAETGITVMYMAEGWDNGDILLKESLRITQRETAGELHDRLAQIAPHALMQALDLLGKGQAPRLPQDPALVTYAPKLRKEDGHIHWNEPAGALDRRIRAMHPWPGAFCWWKEKTFLRRLRILRAEPRDNKGQETPGQILCVGEGIEVQCLQDSLLLCEVQLEGRKPMTAVEFARGYSVCRGSVLS